MSLFCWTQRKIFWRMWETEQVWGTIDFHSIFFPTMEVNGAPKQPGYKLSSKYLPLCSAEQRNSYRFGTTWEWVNDDIIFIFGWTIPLIAFKLCILSVHLFTYSLRIEPMILLLLAPCLAVWATGMYLTISFSIQNILHCELFDMTLFQSDG